MRPSYQLLQAIKRKIKDLEQSATEVDHNAGSPTNDKQEEAPAILQKPDLTNAPTEPNSSAAPPKPDLADVC